MTVLSENLAVLTEPKRAGYWGKKAGKYKCTFMGENNVHHPCVESTKFVDSPKTPSGPLGPEGVNSPFLPTKNLGPRIRVPYTLA